MRWLPIAIALASGCEPPLPAQTLPQLASSTDTERPREPTIRIVAGERLSWNITSNGMAVARAEWVASGTQVRSRIRARGLLAGVRELRHDLTTALAAPGTDVLDVHQALGWVRGIAASTSAGARTTRVDFRGREYTLGAGPPQGATTSGDFGGDSIRVDLVARSPGRRDIRIAAFFAVDHELAPTQVRVNVGSKRVRAALVSREIDNSVRPPGLH